MGIIRIFKGPPKAFEFNQEDLVIDNINGDIYYKDWKGNLQKIIRSNDTNSSLSLKSIEASTQVSSLLISASYALITGNITASGDISASGTIIANTFKSDGQESIDINDNLNITGSITASGGISSSKEIIANTGSFNIIEGGVF